METSIRIARKAAGLTQQQLADKYKIPLRTVVDWDRGVRTPPEYLKDLLLRCIAIDFPTEPVQALSEQVPALKPVESEPVKKPAYTYFDEYGKPLPQKLAELVHTEFVEGRVQLEPEYGQDFHGEPVTSTSRRVGKLYSCTKTKFSDGSEISVGFNFRVKGV